MTFTTVNISCQCGRFIGSHQCHMAFEDARPVPKTYTWSEIEYALRESMGPAMPEYLLDTVRIQLGYYNA